MTTFAALPLLSDINHVVENSTSTPIKSGSRLAGLAQIVRSIRKSALLHPGPSPDPDVLSLNLAQGCAHRCAFCSIRAIPSYSGDDVIVLCEDMAEKLGAELAARRQKPRAVLISPATDPFMPLSEVQAETARAVEVLARQGVEARLLTRGYIRPSVREVLARYRQHVKVTVAITTIDRNLQRTLEPLAAPPRLRLRQIGDLHKLDIPVSVEVAPLVPGLTDRRENLTALLEALAGAGIQHITAGYMFLRPGIQQNMSRVLDPDVWNDILEEYAGGPMLAAGGIHAARYLPRVRRQQGYAALMALASGYGISVGVCRLTNPDFGVDTSRLRGDARLKSAPRMPPTFAGLLAGTRSLFEG
jgi:DNA repair photolyase